MCGVLRYAYCYNNPVNYSDRSGHFPVLALILGITATVGLGLTIGGVASDNNALTAVGLSITGVSALGAGGLALAGAFATGAIATGVVGGLTMTAGAGSLVFASAEAQSALGYGNWMLDAGIDESLYYGLMITTAGLATAGSWASFAMLASNPMTGFTNHGHLQALERNGVGVSRKAILDAVRHPLKTVVQAGGTIKYYGRYAVVVLTGAGEVVTTWATSHLGWRQ